MTIEEVAGPAPEGWAYNTLGAACARGGGDIQTGPFGSQLHASDYVSAGIPSIMPQNIGDNRIVEAGIARITPEDAQRLSRYRVSAGDIVYSRRGDVERRALVRNHEDGWLCGTGCLRVRLGEQGADPRYTSYYLGHPAVREWIVRHAHGATMPNLNTSILASCPFLEPPPAVQRAIGHILGTLDDKIELNRRMSETLEAMAQALFKSWFVDFGPVRAKSERRDPGLPQPLADLFPSSFEDSELGEIPRGWVVGPLGQFFDIGLGGAWGDDEQSPRAPVAVRCLRGIDCHDLAEGRIPDVPVRWLTARQADDRKLPEGAILIEGSGSFCGRSLLWRRVYQDLIGGPVCYSNFCKRLDPRCIAAQAIICWMQMRQAYREGFLQSFRTGTAFPNFDIHGALANLIVVVPPEPLAETFAKIFALSQRLDLMAQARTLAALRDALLPKLISGELRIEDSERLLERASQ